MMNKWQILSQEYIMKHPYLTLKVEKKLSPSVGEHRYFLLEFPDWANVVGITEAGEFILIRQYRHGMNIVNLEIPGGVVDPGEDPSAAAARELEEETGFRPGHIQLLKRVSANPAIQDNWCYLFLATGCVPVGEQRLDSGEEIAVETVSRDKLEHLLESGELHHSLNVLALTLALQKTT